MAPPRALAHETIRLRSPGEHSEPHASFRLVKHGSHVGFATYHRKTVRNTAEVEYVAYINVSDSIAMESHFRVEARTSSWRIKRNCWGRRQSVVSGSVLALFAAGRLVEVFPFCNYGAQQTLMVVHVRKENAKMQAPHLLFVSPVQ